MKYAIAYVGYNRPALTRITFTHLLKARPKDIPVYLFIDGPTEDQGDVQNNLSLRSLLDKLSKGNNKIEKVYRKRNVGLRKNILGGLRKLFTSGYDHVFVIEDDCYLSPDYFDFCIASAKVLGKYDPRYHSIQTVNQHFYPGRRDNSLIKSSWNSSWAYMMPSHTWNMIDPHVNNFLEAIKTDDDDNIRKYFKDTFGLTTLFTGQDSFIACNRVKNAQFSYLSAMSRCKNIGISGYHRPQSKEIVQEALDMLKKNDFSHPEFIGECFVDEYTYDKENPIIIEETWFN